MSKEHAFFGINIILMLLFFWAGITDWGSDSFITEDKTTEVILYQIRFPRIISAFLVGGLLAVSGYLIQLLVNNPLADPYLLGTASGASLGVNLTILGVFPLALLGFYVPVVIAFLFAVLVTLFVLYIGSKKNSYNPLTLILAGVGASSFISALVSLLIYFSDTSNQIKEVVFWTMGSFERIEVYHVPILFGVLFISLFYLFRYGKELQLLTLGKERAEILGLNFIHFKRVIVVISTLCTSVAVAFSGVIGFVGLIVPHIVRATYGTLGKYNLFITAFFGGNLLLCCELISRLIYPPVGLPVGVSTALIGVPIFIYILVKKNYQFGR